MSPDIVYRPAISQDVVKLSILYQQVYIHTYGVEGISDEFAHFITRQFAVERLEQIIGEQPGTITVAAYKDNLVGVAEIGWDKQCPIGSVTAPELDKLYLLEWFCGKGIGQRLLQEAEATIRSRGIKELWLWVLHSNKRAVAFYENHGYQHIGNASFQMETNRYENKVMLKQL